MTRRKYNFPSRAAAEDEIRRLGQQVTLHGIALYCVARNEITWTEFQRGEFGYRCRAGIARASSGHGG
jgi:hypothetical protein